MEKEENTIPAVSEQTVSLHGSSRVLRNGQSRRSFSFYSPNQRYQTNLAFQKRRKRDNVKTNKQERVRQKTLSDAINELKVLLRPLCQNSKYSVLKTAVSYIIEMRQKVEALTNSLAEQQRVVNKLTQYYNSLDQLSKKECQCPVQHCEHLQAVRRSVFGQSSLTTAPPNEVNASSTDNSSEVHSLQSGNDGPTEKERSLPLVQFDQRSATNTQNCNQSLPALQTARESVSQLCNGSDDHSISGPLHLDGGHTSTASFMYPIREVALDLNSSGNVNSSNDASKSLFIREPLSRAASQSSDLNIQAPGLISSVNGHSDLSMHEEQGLNSANRFHFVGSDSSARTSFFATENSMPSPSTTSVKESVPQIGDNDRTPVSAYGQQLTNASYLTSNAEHANTSKPELLRSIQHMTWASDIPASSRTSQLPSRESMPTTSSDVSYFEPHTTTTSTLATHTEMSSLPSHLRSSLTSFSPLQMTSSLTPHTSSILAPHNTTTSMALQSTSSERPDMTSPMSSESSSPWPSSSSPVSSSSEPDMESSVSLHWLSPMPPQMTAPLPSHMPSSQVTSSLEPYTTSSVDNAHATANDTVHATANVTVNATANDSTHATANDIPHATADNIADAKANDNAHAKVNDNAHVGADDNALTRANDIDHAGANDIVHSKANDNAHAKANDNAHAGANDNAQSGANVNAQAGANDNAQTGANDNAQAGANDNAQAGANDNAQAGANDNAQAGANDNAQAGANDNAQTGEHDNAHAGANDIATIHITALHIFIGTASKIPAERKHIIATSTTLVNVTCTIRVNATCTIRVNATGTIRVIATGTTPVIATGTKRVIATRTIPAIATGTTRVNATRTTRVNATGTIRVIATGTIRVIATGTTRVIATGTIFFYATGTLFAIVISRIHAEIRATLYRDALHNTHYLATGMTNGKIHFFATTNKIVIGLTYKSSMSCTFAHITSSKHFTEQYQSSYAPTSR
ncbi:proteoglycan 4 [Biomphalaria pfeifferi]|uniref:Proteoglycan 4 n=1 Tax=Biomphalaria pfeifferi TaxID=112525 RepID=A0AAD8FH29_BIOPF|nr:proteoglycan 4 [Biomphalaria pfeifferi]